MQPFAIGTVVRSKSDEASRHYIHSVYGQLNGLMVEKYTGWYSHDHETIASKTHVRLCRLDGSDPTQDGFGNCAPIRMLELDTFMHAARQAVASAEETPDGDL